MTLGAVYSDMTVLRCAGFSVLVAGGAGAQRDPVLLETADIRRPVWVQRSFSFSDNGRLTAMEVDRTGSVWGGSSEGSVSVLRPGVDTADRREKRDDGIVAFVDDGGAEFVTVTEHEVVRGGDAWPLPSGTTAQAAVALGGRLYVGGVDAWLASAALPDLTKWLPVPFGHPGAWSDPDDRALLPGRYGLAVVATNGVYDFDPDRIGAPPSVRPFPPDFEPVAAAMVANTLWVAGHSERQALVVGGDAESMLYRNGPGYLNRSKPDCLGLKDEDHCPTQSARGLCALPDGRVAVLDRSSYASTAIVLLDPVGAHE